MSSNNFNFTTINGAPEICQGLCHVLEIQDEQRLKQWLSTLAASKEGSQSPGSHKIPSVPQPHPFLGQCVWDESRHL